MTHLNPPFEILWFKSPAYPVSLPFVSCSVAAGFPSPADDHIDETLDLMELLVKRPAATFYIRVKGESLRGIGICDGDIIIVDRSKSVRDGCILVASVDTECLVKIYRCEAGRVWLQSANPSFPDLALTEQNEFQVWGVVTGVVREL